MPAFTLDISHSIIWLACFFVGLFFYSIIQIWIQKIFNLKNYNFFNVILSLVFLIFLYYEITKHGDIINFFSNITLFSTILVCAAACVCMIIYKKFYEPSYIEEPFNVNEKSENIFKKPVSYILEKTAVTILTCIFFKAFLLKGLINFYGLTKGFTIALVLQCFTINLPDLIQFLHTNKSNWILIFLSNSAIIFLLSEFYVQTDCLFGCILFNMLFKIFFSTDLLIRCIKNKNRQPKSSNAVNI